jgi:hypothetical protein
LNREVGIWILGIERLQLGRVDEENFGLAIRNTPSATIINKIAFFRFIVKLMYLNYNTDQIHLLFNESFCLYL